MEKNKIHIYLYNALIVLCLLGGAVYVVSQFMHFGGGEFTDNARVRQNVVPQSSRVQGFIREVRFADFQQVKKGDTLAIIEMPNFACDWPKPRPTLSVPNTVRRERQAASLPPRQA